MDGGTILYYPLAGEEPSHGQYSGRVSLFDSSNRADHGGGKDKDEATLPVIICCGGFPDDAYTSLVPLARHLSSNSSGSVVIGVTCLPGYDTMFLEPGQVKRGYTFEEMVTSLESALKVLVDYVQQQNRGRIELSGVFHDWGCVVGAMLSNRRQRDQIPFTKLVYLDVLPPLHPDWDHDNPWWFWEGNAYKLIATTAYRVWFGACWALRQVRLVRWLVGPVCAVGSSLLSLTGLAPLCDVDHETFTKQRTARPVTLSQLVDMMYPYFFMYWHGRQLVNRRQSGFHLPRNVIPRGQKVETVVPVLYLYGLDKNVQFHVESHLQWLQQQQQQLLGDHEDTTSVVDDDDESSCWTAITKSPWTAVKRPGTTAVVAIPQAGHWFYLQRPKLCYPWIQQFLLSR
jgi:pimeloyl-ACP methyl ester carboxylesterase